VPYKRQRKAIKKLDKWHTAFHIYLSLSPHKIMQNFINKNYFFYLCYVAFFANVNLYPYGDMRVVSGFFV